MARSTVMSVAPSPLLACRFLCDLCASASSVLKKRAPHAPVLFDTENTEAQRTQSQCSRRQERSGTSWSMLYAEVGRANSRAPLHFDRRVLDQLRPELHHH